MPRKKKLPVTIDIETESNHVRINERGIITGLAVEPETRSNLNHYALYDDDDVIPAQRVPPSSMTSSRPIFQRPVPEVSRQWSSGQQEVYRTVRERERGTVRYQALDRQETIRKDATKNGKYTVLVEPGVIVRYDEQTVFEAKQFVNRENFGNHVPVTDEYVHRLVAYAVYHRYHARDKTQTIEAAKPKAPIGKVHRRIKQLDLTPLEE